MSLLILGIILAGTTAINTFQVKVLILINWAANGFFQSAGGPVGTAIMVVRLGLQCTGYAIIILSFTFQGNWFPLKNRGWVFGVWTGKKK